MSQLVGRLPVETLRRFDRIADAITELQLHGYLSDTGAHRARERLVNMVKREFEQQAERVRKQKVPQAIWVQEVGK